MNEPVNKPVNDTMSDKAFESRLQERCEAAHLLLAPSQLPSLRAYYQLLQRWNERINLTALPLAGYPPQTIDRLLLEPIAASDAVPADAKSWVDLGSGGGSPAIPMAIARPKLRLTMTESRGRKAAFLREAARLLGLKAEVLSGRFEELLNHPAGSVDLITARAVRIEDVAALTSHLLSSSGRLLLFGSVDVVAPQGLQLIDKKPLPAENAHLFQFKKA